jgi:hypothetical protein
MDDARFDTLTRSLAGPSPSRRQVLMGLAGSTLAALTTAIGFAEAGATHFSCLHVGERSTDASQCCSSLSKRKRGTSKRFCRAHHAGRCTATKDICVTAERSCAGGSCACFRTTGGVNYCADPDAGACMACITDAECASALNRPGSACIDLSSGCICNGFATSCAAPCKA